MGVQTIQFGYGSIPRSHRSHLRRRRRVSSKGSDAPASHGALRGKAMPWFSSLRFALQHCTSISTPENMARRSRDAICVRVLHLSHPPERGGRREDRVAACTRGPRAEKIARGALTTGTGGNTPAFPARWFTAYFALSSVSQTLLSPSSCGVGASSSGRTPRNIFTRLGASLGAPGPHDFAVREHLPKSSTG